MLTGNDDGEDHGSFPIRFGLYAGIQVLSGVSVFVMARFIERADLLDKSTPPEMIGNTYVRTAALAGTFLVSIPLAFVIGSWAYVVWVAMQLTTRLAFVLYRRRHPELATP